MMRKLALALVLACSGMLAADDSVEKTVKDLYASSQAALRTASTKEEPASDKRPLPKLDFLYIRQTGWNVLVVYWNSRRSGNRVVGSLYRDTWVRTADEAFGRRSSFPTVLYSRMESR